MLLKMKRHSYTRMHNAQYIRLVKLSDNCRIRWTQTTQLQFFGSGIGRASLPRIARTFRSPIDDIFAEWFSTPNSPIWICARMRTKSSYFSPDTSQQSNENGRSIGRSLRDFFFPSCCDITPSLSLSLSPCSHICIVLCLGLDPQAGPIISREVYGMVHNSVDKNNQVWLLVMTGLSYPA